MNVQQISQHCHFAFCNVSASLPELTRNKNIRASQFSLTWPLNLSESFQKQAQIQFFSEKWKITYRIGKQFWELLCPTTGGGGLRRLRWSLPSPSPRDVLVRPNLQSWTGFDLNSDDFPFFKRRMTDLVTDNIKARDASASKKRTFNSHLYRPGETDLYIYRL